MNGVAIRVKNEDQFNEVKSIIGKDMLYIDWVPQMSITDTAVVIFSKEKNRSIGSIGMVEMMKLDGFKIINL